MRPDPAHAALLVWQGPAQSAPAHGNVLLWQGVAQAPGQRSLTEYLEEHGTEVRRRYLAWSYELGETRLLGRALRERLRVPRAGSLWPVSMFVEQSTWRQASLEKIVKLQALELLIADERPESLRFAGADRDLSRVLEALCRERQVRYSWHRLAPCDAARRRWWQHLPHTLQGLTAPVHFLLRSRGLPRAQPSAASGARRVLLCAPFINHSATLAAAREFSSQYWTVLPKLLAREGCELLWLHMFYRHERIPTAAVAARIVARIGTESRASGSHGFVGAYFSVPGMLRVYLQWALVALESLVLGLCLRVRFAQRPRESYWPLLRADWASAFRGMECTDALFHLECFDQALGHIAHQDEGIYLMENQGWERALIRAWRRHGHGRLTAVAHSTLRFWDLRYHCDPRRYEPAQRGHIPEADVVAVNGAHARREFLATCASRERLVECEALRYLELTPRAPAPPRTRSAAEPQRLLVLGDFLPESTLKLLRLLGEALSAGRPGTQVWVKAHPNCPVDPAQLPGVALRIVNDAVPALAAQVDLVLASNTTSAALEAYLGGARVLVYDDRGGVNFSPLRAVPAVRFVHSSSELRAALTELDEVRAAEAPGATEFFYTDAALPRWRDYLGIGSHQPEAYPEDSTT